MVTYRLYERLNPGLVGLESERYGLQLWTRGRLRKATRCAGCRHDLPAGREVFRPVSNGDNRYHRLCLACVDR